MFRSETRSKVAHRDGYTRIGSDFLWQERQKLQESGNSQRIPPKRINHRLRRVLPFRHLECQTCDRERDLDDDGARPCVERLKRRNKGIPEGYQVLLIDLVEIVGDLETSKGEISGHVFEEQQTLVRKVCAANIFDGRGACGDCKRTLQVDHASG